MQATTPASAEPDPVTFESDCMEISMFDAEKVHDLQVLGLLSLRYFSSLMPLLLEWSKEDDQLTQLKALLVLQEVVTYTWPRMTAHASFLWSQLQTISADQQFLPNSSTSNAVSPGLQKDIQRAVCSVAELLYMCGGSPFQKTLNDAVQMHDDQMNAMLRAIAKLGQCQ